MLALVTHLWMLGDAPHAGLPDHGIEPVTVSTATPLHVPGCTSAMSTCQVPMPMEDLAALILLASSVLWVVAGREPEGRHRCRLTRFIPSERAPPRPYVPESVVLLV